MSSFSKFEEALRIAASHPDADFEGEFASQVVDQLAELLQTDIPRSYSKFLQTLGCGSIGGTEIYGIVRAGLDAKGIPNVAWITKRKLEQGVIARGMIVIADEGDGSLLVIDARTGVQDGVEAPVVRVSLDGSTLDPVARSFTEYFVSEVEMMVKRSL
jgi:hypothetical protein